MTRWENKRNISVPDSADMRLNQGVVSDRILAAYRKVSAHLTRLGVPHLVVGGLAVGAWGHPRATKDVDLLVRQQDAFDGTLLLSFKPGIPIQVDGVSIDYLTVEGLGLRGGMPLSADVSVISLELLFAMKLRAKRSQDDADLIALLNGGADIEVISVWLEAHGFTAEQKRLVLLAKKAAREQR